MTLYRVEFANEQATAAGLKPVMVKKVWAARLWEPVQLEVFWIKDLGLYQVIRAPGATNASHQRVDDGYMRLEGGLLPSAYPARVDDPIYRTKAEAIQALEERIRCNAEHQIKGLRKRPARVRAVRAEAEAAIVKLQVQA